MRLLVLYHANFTYTPTIRDYLEAIGRHSASAVDYFNVDQPEPVDFAYYDAVFVNFCVTSQARLEKPPEFWTCLVAALARFEGIKAAAVQDEYDFTNRVKAFFLEAGIDIVLTNVPQEAVHRVYAEPEFFAVHFETVQTAYFAAGQDDPTLPLAERPIALGYRGRELPYRLGDLGWHKAEVGRQFKLACRQRAIACDIEVDEDSRFHGDAWPRFIRSCRVMLGSPSGSCVFDFDGGLHRQMRARYRETPNLRYEEVRDEVLAHDLGFDMGQISARIFEAVAARTALALVRGNYSGVVEPDEHYLPIEPDYSNVDEVLDRILDVPAMQAMADRAFEHVTAEPANRYENLVELLDQLMKGIARGHGVCHLAVTDHPLGTDPYLIDRLTESRRALKACERSLREFVEAAAENRLEVTRDPSGAYRVLRFAGVKV